MALTRTVSQHEEITVGLAAADAYQAIGKALQTLGKVQTTETGLFRLTGWLRKTNGWPNNKATVSVIVEPIDASKSVAKFTVSAQEGLVDQNTCGLALSRLLAEAALSAPSVI